jgi:formylglycine-generating enzyme required for sulfatase activity
MNKHNHNRKCWINALWLLSAALLMSAWMSLAADTPRTATATATVMNGFLVAITVTDGGAGYPVPPTVTISGGGGSGAIAEAAVSNGTVITITVKLAGWGYTSVPQVVISAPPPPEAPVLESVRLASALTIRGSVGTTNWILYADALDPYNWRVLTNLVVTGSPYVVFDWEASPLRRFYQAASGPEPPVFQPDTNRWVWIPPGTFTMGSPATEQDRDSDEGPQTVVTITRGFWMGRYEVTQAEYQAVMGSNPSYFKGDLNRPVEQVSWNDAINYCGKLTERERQAGRLPAGYEYRLPTEAQWEYVCRAGTTTRFSYGDDPGYSQLGNYAWYYANSGGTTHAVGLKQPNGWGLYDMSGNVLEWCLDWYASSLSGGSVNDPTGPSLGSIRVNRGGGCNGSGRHCRSAYRTGDDPDFRYNGLGFRLVLVAVP